MGKTIRISELIGTDVRSRSNAGIIQSALDGEKDCVALDFAEVTFVSRSFADELCNILDNSNNVRLIHTCQMVQSMIDAVKEGRSQKRIRVEDHSEIKEFDTMESLSSFLATI